MNKKLTIIVIGHNSWHFLQKNFSSLEFLKEEQDVEVLYVDNASTDETRVAVSYSYPNIKMICYPINRGVAAARNIGMVNAASEYIMFLDSDTEMNKEAYYEMMKFMDENPDVGVCGCKLYGQDGVAQNSCKKYPTRKSFLKSIARFLGKKIGLNLYPNAYIENNYDMEKRAPFDVDYVIGACQLIRKKAQTKVGFLDEKIFYGPEDADFCMRIKRAGYRVVYLPNVSISHAYIRPSTNKLFSKLTWKQICGMFYFFNKVDKYK